MDNTDISCPGSAKEKYIVFDGWRIPPQDKM
jgi:hypothetical protein